MQGLTSMLLGPSITSLQTDQKEGFTHSSWRCEKWSSAAVCAPCLPSWTLAGLHLPQNAAV